MLSLNFQKRNLKIILFGAHCDDIEIGCGATILSLKRKYNFNLSVIWTVFTSDQIRKKEAEKSAHSFLQGIKEKEVLIFNHQDSYLPVAWKEVKLIFEKLKSDYNPDLIFTHFRNDLHQDHRIINELTWNTYRNHLILEYEIPKYDGDLDKANFFVPVPKSLVEKKNKILFNSFKSQIGKRWFTPDLIEGLMRIRGLETNQNHLFAEAFYARKIII